MCLGWDHWKHYKFGPDQLLFASLRVINKESQEMVKYGYRRNVKEYNAGIVKLGEKILKFLSC